MNVPTTNLKRITMIRLTSPENFDKLMGYLESHFDLEWPYNKYRDYFVCHVKELIKTDTVFLDITYLGVTQEKHPRIKAYILYVVLSDIPTEEEFMNPKDICDRTIDND